MKGYAYKARDDSVQIFIVEKIYETIQVAALMIAIIPDISTVISVNDQPNGQRAV